MSVDDLGFNPDWLNERFPFDSKARNAQVETECLNFLSTINNPVITDLGCGNGANTKYFINRIPVSHQWILVDNDQNLLNHALENLSKLEGYQISQNQSSSGLVLANENKQVTVDTACGSLLELDQFLDLQPIHLLMANAVFDLFSEEQFTSFARMLKNNNLPFLATLNYSSMQFSPESNHDELFVKHYEAHMQREQSFGKGMGNHCFSIMKRLLTEMGIQLTVGPSNWEILPTDTNMLNFLHHYLDDSLHELPLPKEEARLLEPWLTDKRKAIDKEIVCLQVGHYDLFAKV